MLMSAAAADHAVTGDFITTFRPTVRQRMKVPMNSLATMLGSEGFRPPPRSDPALMRSAYCSSPPLPPTRMSRSRRHSLWDTCRRSTASVPRLCSLTTRLSFSTSSERWPGSPSSGREKVKVLPVLQTGLRLLLMVGVRYSWRPSRTVTYGSETSPRRPESLFARFVAERICTCKLFAPGPPATFSTSRKRQRWKRRVARPAPRNW
mmetsp:Transcript_99403/g.315516  ORF Transcript_99403/g.315516 Transcript_99403/m.315516 type:complete len:206 (-) Transcript_99403:348-965(-)